MKRFSERYLGLQRVCFCYDVASGQDSLLITLFLAPVPSLGFSKSSATLAAADPCIPMLSYCTLCLLEYLEVIPNARFPHMSLVFMIFCIQARHLQIFLLRLIC